jgi:hypothetical protein
VDPRAGLNDVEKRKFLILPGLELRPLGVLEVVHPKTTSWCSFYVPILFRTKFTTKYDMDGATLVSKHVQ